LVPSKSTEWSPYTLSDLKYDCKHRSLTHVDPSSSAPSTPIAAIAFVPSWYDRQVAEEGKFDTITPSADLTAMLTQEQRDVIAGVRDVRTDATVVVHNEYLSHNGTATHDTWYLEDETRSPEPPLDSPKVYYADPKNYKDAMACPDSRKWMEAYKAEVNSITKSGCWEFVKRPVHTRPGRIIVVWKLKHNADGTVDRYKVRMCFDGSTETADVEVYQHVAEMDTFKVFVASATQHDEVLMQTDVDNAFLHGRLKVPLYAHAPNGMYAPKDETGANKVLKIGGNLYGARAAPRVYGQLFDSHLQTLPTTKADGSTTVLLRGRADHSTWHVMRTLKCGRVVRCDILVYVDDNLFKFADTDECWGLYRDICSHIDKRLPLKRKDGEYGERASSFLGCNIRRDLRRGVTTLSTPAKIKSAIDAMGMGSCNPRSQVGELKNVLRTRESTGEAACNVDVGGAFYAPRYHAAYRGASSVQPRSGP